MILWAFYLVRDNRLLYRDLTKRHEIDHLMHVLLMQPLYALFSVNTSPNRSPIRRGLKLTTTSAAVSFNGRHNRFSIADIESTKSR